MNWYSHIKYSFQVEDLSDFINQDGVDRLLSDIVNAIRQKYASVTSLEETEVGKFYYIDIDNFINGPRAYIEFIYNSQTYPVMIEVYATHIEEEVYLSIQIHDPNQLGGAATFNYYEYNINKLLDQIEERIQRMEENSGGEEGETIQLPTIGG